MVSWKKSHRALGAVASVVVLGLSLTACGGGSSSSTSAASGASKTTYTWWDPYPQHDATSAWAKRVNQCGKQAGVTIKRTAYDTTNLTNQALLAAQAGKSPDVLLLDNPAVPTLSSAGTLVDNATLGLSTSGYEKNLLGAGELNGKSYGIPIGANTLALYYNKTILAKAGVNPDSIKDWASLTAVLAKVKATGSGGITFAAIGTEEGSFQFLPWFWGAGANLTNLDSPQAVKALTLLKGWLDKGYAPNSVLNNSQNTTWEEFLTGKYAFGLNGTWQVDAAAKASFKTGVINIPAENGGTATAPTGGEFLEVPVQKDTSRYTITKKIVSCMTSTAGQVQTANTFAYYIPPTAAGQAKLLASNPSLKPWVTAVNSAKGRTSDNLGVKYAKISQQMWTAEQNALSGAKTPQQALEDAQTQAAQATK